jgi:hypothetical protein
MKEDFNAKQLQVQFCLNSNFSNFSYFFNKLLKFLIFQCPWFSDKTALFFFFFAVKKYKHPFTFFPCESISCKLPLISCGPYKPDTFKTLPQLSFFLSLLLSSMQFIGMVSHMLSSKVWQHANRRDVQLYTFWDSTLDWHVVCNHLTHRQSFLSAHCLVQTHGQVPQLVWIEQKWVNSLAASNETLNILTAVSPCTEWAILTSLQMNIWIWMPIFKFLNP